MAIGKPLEELMSKIGYSFANEEYLQNALTHSSYSNEYRSRGLNLPSNERLEFLGDAVLQLVISEYIYHNYTDLAEGRLTRIRQNLVCEKTLARVAKKYNVGDYIHLGRGEESECRSRPKVLADTLEAIIGAVFVDASARGGEYKAIVENMFSDEIRKAVDMPFTDCKTTLQQFVEKVGGSLLEYVVVDEQGPEHAKIFTVVAKVNNNVVGEGVAGSKKEAEMKAARQALDLFGIGEDL